MAPQSLARRCTRLLVFSLSLAVCLACPPLLHAGNSQVTEDQSAAAPQTATATTEISMSLLVNRAWKITVAPSVPPAGSIYIFLQNGTLLETSCVETYRIATWTSEKNAPHVLRIIEDHRTAFTATILELTPSTLRLRQRFVRSHERREITLTAVTGEFVCSDLPR